MGRFYIFITFMQLYVSMPIAVSLSVDFVGYDRILSLSFELFE